MTEAVSLAVPLPHGPVHVDLYPAGCRGECTQVAGGQAPRRATLAHRGDEPLGPVRVRQAGGTDHSARQGWTGGTNHTARPTLTCTPRATAAIYKRRHRDVVSGTALQHVLAGYVRVSRSAGAEAWRTGHWRPRPPGYMSLGVPGLKLRNHRRPSYASAGERGGAGPGQMLYLTSCG